ncbi:MAG: tetratricopeptide repeat protein [Deltaproteobacteria bacterium]|nr:tetratricopeptide repeat protein [Deltaproteobacteria bacterium]
MKPYIVLILLVAITFANSLQNEFVWDDHTLIIDNPNINLPLTEIPSIFTKSLWKVGAVDEGRHTYYRPLLSMLYLLNYKIWGFNPKGFHLTNILLHLLNAVVLYRIGLLLFNDTSISLAAASIFAVHPVHNESVGRAAAGEVIFGFFIILSIYFFLKEKRYISWFSFFLALLSKETSVMLPFALLILAINKQDIKKGIIEIMPYMILIGVYFIIRAMVVDVVLGGGVILQLLHYHIFSMLTMAVAALDYISLLIIPYPLSPFYSERWYRSILEIKVMLAIIVLALLSFLAFRIRKDRVMFFLLLSPFIMLFPVIWRVNTFTAGLDNMYIAERFLYVPLMLFSLFVSASLVKIFNGRAKRYLLICWILVIIIFIPITIFANTMWRNDTVLFKKVIENSPDTAFAHNGLGSLYEKQGHLDEAIKEYSIALSVKPYYSDAHANLGNIYADKGMLDEAIKEYLIALKLQPDNAGNHNNLGNAYADKGLLDEAIKEYETAIRLKPDYADAHYNLGIVYYEKGRHDDAKREYLTASELKPSLREMHNKNKGFKR